MAWVETRGSCYLVRWRDERGQKKQRLFRVESEARQFADASAGPPRTRGGGEATVGAYLRMTLAASEDLRESTRYHYVSIARKHIEPALGEVPLRDVTASQLRALLGEMRESGYSDSYRSITRNILGRTFRLAVSEGLLARSPLQAVPAVRRGGRPEVGVLDVAQVEALASAILPRYRGVVLTMAYAGLRIGEVGGIEMSSLNLLTRELRVRSAVARAGGRLIVSGPKTAAGRRTVPLPDFLIHELREHIDRFGLAPDGRVFHTPRVNQHRDHFGLLHAGSFHKPFRKARARVGLPHAHPHTLRHSYAAFLIKQGAHPKVMQALMGHASIKVTLDLYGHLLPGLGQELAERLDALRASEPGAAERDRLLP